MVPRMEKPSATVVQAQTQLEPLLRDVIDQLDASGNAWPMAFFTQQLLLLKGLSDDADLLNLFFELSSTAFQGFVLSEDEARVVDVLLARCEDMAHALSAPDDHPH